MRRAVDAARNISLPDDREVLHVLPHEFIVDAQDGIRDAIGMVGQRLEANVHFVTSSVAATQNLVTAANQGRHFDQRHGAGAAGFSGVLPDAR